MQHIHITSNVKGSEKKERNHNIHLHVKVYQTSLYSTVNTLTNQ